MNLTHAALAGCWVRQERPGGLGLSEEVAEEKVVDIWVDPSLQRKGIDRYLFALSFQF